MASGRSQLKDLTLSALEFIRRFSLHISFLRDWCVSVTMGILGNNRRKRAIKAARAISIFKNTDLLDSLLIAYLTASSDSRAVTHSGRGQLFGGPVAGYGRY
jgi:hypothetical protein